MEPAKHSQTQSLKVLSLGPVWSNVAELSHRRVRSPDLNPPLKCSLTLYLGGHADFGPPGSSSGCCGGHSQSLGRTADGVPQVLKATREELKGGADFIKIMCGGGVASPTDAIETVQFTAEEIRAITTTCNQTGNKHSAWWRYHIRRRRR